MKLVVLFVAWSGRRTHTLASACLLRTNPSPSTSTCIEIETITWYSSGMWGESTNLKSWYHESVVDRREVNPRGLIFTECIHYGGWWLCQNFFYSTQHQNSSIFRFHSLELNKNQRKMCFDWKRGFWFTLSMTRIIIFFFFAKKIKPFPRYLFSHAFKLHGKVSKSWLTIWSLKVRISRHHVLPYLFCSIINTCMYWFNSTRKSNSI